MLDIFNNDAFSVTSLTEAVNNIAYAPGRVGELGLFGVKPVRTTSVAIEQKNGVLSLVSPTPRGAPGETKVKQTRVMRNLNVPHFQRDDAIMADEVQGIRAFGSETELMQVVDLVNERTGEHSMDLAITEEHARLGAIKGVVTYANGDTLDLFSEFGVSQHAELAFDLTVKDTGALRTYCAGVVRTLAGYLGGTPFGGVHAFCGDNFFDELLANPEVRATYDGWSEAKILREGYISPNGKIYSAFEFGGIVWENYRGNSDLGGEFVHTDKCHIFPIGVPNLFKTYYAPADYIETVNTLGKSRYAKQIAMRNDKGVELEVQTNVLSICTRPLALLKGKKGA